MSAPDPLVAALGPRWAPHATAVRAAAEAAGAWYDRVYGSAPRWTPADSRALRGVRRRLAALVAAIEALDGTPAAYVGGYWFPDGRGWRGQLARLERFVEPPSRPHRRGNKRAWTGRHEAQARAALEHLAAAGMRLSTGRASRTWRVLVALELPVVSEPRPTLRRLVAAIKGGNSR